MFPRKEIRDNGYPLWPVVKFHIPLVSVTHPFNFVPLEIKVNEARTDFLDGYFIFVKIYV